MKNRNNEFPLSQLVTNQNLLQIENEITLARWRALSKFPSFIIYEFGY